MKRLRWCAPGEIRPGGRDVFGGEANDFVSEIVEGEAGIEREVVRQP
jgi:hypothetical protein